MESRLPDPKDVAACNDWCTQQRQAAKDAGTVAAYLLPAGLTEAEVLQKLDEVQATVPCYGSEAANTFAATLDDIGYRAADWA